MLTLITEEQISKLHQALVAYVSAIHTYRLTWYTEYIRGFTLTLTKQAVYLCQLGPFLLLKKSTEPVHQEKKGQIKAKCPNKTIKHLVSKATC